MCACVRACVRACVCVFACVRAARAPRVAVMQAKAQLSVNDTMNLLRTHFEVRGTTPKGLKWRDGGRGVDDNDDNIAVHAIYIYVQNTFRIMRHEPSDQCCNAP